MNPIINVGKSTSGHSSSEKFWTDVLKESKELNQRPNMYGSDAGHCPRKNFLYATEEKQQSVFSATSKIYMGIGNGVEDVLADSLAADGRLFFQNLYLPPMNPVVRGKIDLVYLNAKNQIAITELKTCGNLPTKPKENHLSQLKTYSAVGGYDVTDIVYISRNVADPKTGFKNLLIKVFPIELTKEDHIDTLTKVCLSSLAIENNLLPPIPSTFYKSVHCNYCPFYNACWDDPFAFNEYEKIESNSELFEEAEDMAMKLYIEREYRYTKSLRHLYRNVEDESLKNRLIEEIEKYESF